jgi:hypothetical protein
MGSYIAISKLLTKLKVVIVLIAAKGSWAISIQLIHHFERRSMFSMETGRCDIGPYCKPIAILHQHMSHEIEFRCLTVGFGVNASIRTCNNVAFNNISGGMPGRPTSE